VLYSPAEIIVYLKEQDPTRWSNLVWISGVGFQPDSFEELAMPLFDRLYNFAPWLTQNREEAETWFRKPMLSRQMVVCDLDFVKSARSTYALALHYGRLGPRQALSRGEY
jgi:hypothetical protein